MLVSSIRDDNPVVFIEHEKLYNMTGEVPEGEYTVPIGSADIKREGEDVTLLTYAYMTHVSLKAAGELEAEGISVEVIDLRTLRPLDEEAILKSVKKTNRVVIVEEDVITMGMGAELAAIIAEKGFFDLDASIIRVAERGFDSQFFTTGAINISPVSTAMAMFMCSLYFITSASM